MPTYTHKGQYLYPVHFHHKMDNILNNYDNHNENNNVHHHYQHSHATTQCWYYTLVACLWTLLGCVAVVVVDVVVCWHVFSCIVGMVVLSCALLWVVALPLVVLFVCCMLCGAVPGTAITAACVMLFPVCPVWLSASLSFSTMSMLYQIELLIMCRSCVLIVSFTQGCHIACLLSCCTVQGIICMTARKTERRTERHRDRKRSEGDPSRLCVQPRVYLRLVVFKNTLSILFRNPSWGPSQ